MYLVEFCCADHYTKEVIMIIMKEFILRRTLIINHNNDEIQGERAVIMEDYLAYEEVSQTDVHGVSASSQRHAVNT